MKSIGWDTSFHLNGKFPLLDNSIFPNLKAARLFVLDPASSAIAGTIIGIDDPSNSDESGLYEIFNNNGELILRKLVSEGTLSGYQTKIDSLITDLSGNYSSELAEFAAQLTKLLETLRDEMFSPDNDTTPITRTMMLLVGADSTNYRFSTNKIGSKDTDGVVFNSSEKSLTFLSGTLYHFSITDSSGKPKTWNIPDSSYIELEGTEESLGKYIYLPDYVKKGESLWVYLKVPKIGPQGNWFLSSTKYGCVLDSTLSPGEGLMLGDSNYYYLLYGYCGIISAGSPFFEYIYGNTWIKGSTIYTGKVQTMDGYSSLDLDNNTLKLGNDFYYSDGLVVVGNPNTGAFVFHKHGESDTALHVGTMTRNSNGNESWNGMTFANGELTIGKYDEKLQEIQTLLDKEVSTWYGKGIPLPYKETEDGNIISNVSPEVAASYNNNTLITENKILKFNLSPSPELLSYHINDIYINTVTGTGYRLVVTNYGTETLSVYWLQLSLGDLLNILNLINSVNSEVNNIKTALDITADGQTTIGDKFIETMMLRIGADSTNYTLSKTSTSGNRILNLTWDENGTLSAIQEEQLVHNSYYWISKNTEGVKSNIWKIKFIQQDYGEENRNTDILAYLVSSTDTTTPIYIYIKADKFSENAGWYWSIDTPLSLQDEQYYYFPFGTIVNQKELILVEVRGNTKIVGDRIITGKLESNTGNSFFDLDNGQFALGIDLNDPSNLDKATFSFNGSKVHIGGILGIDYLWKDIDQSEATLKMEFNNALDAASYNEYLGEIYKLLIFSNVEPGYYKISIPELNFDYDPLIREYLNGEEITGMHLYCICIGTPKYGSDGYITNTLIDINDNTCEFGISKVSDLYILRGTSLDYNGSFNFEYVDETNPNSGYLEYKIKSIILSKQYNSFFDPELRNLLLITGSTDISGGLILTNCLGVRNSLGTITAGLCGVNDGSNKTAFWAGDTIDNKENAPVRLTFDGINSLIGPLKVSSDSKIEIIGKENSSKLCLIDNSNSACIKVLNGKNVLKLEASDVNTITSTVYNTSDYWESSVILSGLKMSEGNTTNTSIDLISGTIDLSKTLNTSNGTYTHTTTSYNTYPAPTILKFVGNVNNTYNKFGLVAKLNLYIGDGTTWGEAKTLALINKQILDPSYRDNGINRLDSDHKSFLVSFNSTSLSELITTEDFGKKYKITLDIIELSRCWSGVSMTHIIKDGKVYDKDTLKSWSILLILDSGLKVKCDYKATFVPNSESSSGSVGIKYALGLISPEGLQFIKDLNMFSVKVGDSSLIITLGGLPKKSGTPLGIDSDGHLCILSS